MLLPADANRLYFLCSFANFLDAFLDGSVGRVDPFLGILLHVTRREVRDEVVLPLSGSQDVAVLCVNHDGFRALSSTIDTDVNHRDSGEK